MGPVQKSSTRPSSAREAALELARRTRPGTLDCLVERFFDMQCNSEMALDFRDGVIKNVLKPMNEEISERPPSPAQIILFVRLLCKADADDAIGHLNDLLESLGKSRYGNLLKNIWGADAVLKIIDVVCAHHDNRDWFIASIPKETRLEMIPFLLKIPNSTAERFIDALFPPPQPCGFEIIQGHETEITIEVE